MMLRGAMVWVGARYPNERGAGAVGIAGSGWSLFAGRGRSVDWRISGVDIVPNLVLGDGDVLLYIHGFTNRLKRQRSMPRGLPMACALVARRFSSAGPHAISCLIILPTVKAPRGRANAGNASLVALRAGRVNIVAHSMGAMLASKVCGRPMQAWDFSTDWRFARLGHWRPELR